MGIWTVAIALSVYGAIIVEAWGDVGHRIVGALADRNISEISIKRLTTVLPAQATLASVADWADHVKYSHDWIWTRPLHYADTDAWQCGFQTARDCPNGEKCVVGAVANYTRRLREPSWGHHNNRTVDLMLLVHFIGDLAQPLHVGFKQDKGGNELHGSFLGRHTNLHAVWDELVLEHRLHNDFHGSEHDYIDYLWNQASHYPAPDPCRDDEHLPDCFKRWATDSAARACEHAYLDEHGVKIVSGFDLGPEYYDKAIGVVEHQLTVAGQRLAWLLDQILRLQMPIYVDYE